MTNATHITFTSVAQKSGQAVERAHNTHVLARLIHRALTAGDIERAAYLTSQNPWR